MNGKITGPGSSSAKRTQPSRAPTARTEGPPATTRNRPPTGRINQKYKRRSWKQQQQKERGEPAAPSPPIWPGEPGYERTKKGRQQQLFRQLIEQYGPNFADTDVRLYLKKRQLNAARGKPSRRGGFPLDDALTKPETFHKLSLDFKRTILQERSAALADALPQLPCESAWRLYSAVPSLLTLLTLEVAHKLRAMARATGLSPADVADQLCSFSPLAFLHPGSAEGRLGLLGKVARLNRQQTVQLLNQHPQLWCMNSRLLAPRCEELALALSCCSVTALKLLATCPPLLKTRIALMQQQLEKLCSVMGCSGRPAEVVTLLLWQPQLLLPPYAVHQQPVISSSDNGSRKTGSLLHSQEQQQGAGNKHAKGVQSPEQVSQQLQCLCHQLRLPLSVVQVMVRRTPGLLSLCSSNSSSNAASGQDGRAPDPSSRERGSTARGSAAAAAAAVFSSWLCTFGAAAQRREYQSQLLQLVHLTVDKDRQQRQRSSRSKAQPPIQQQQWLPLGVCRFASSDDLAYIYAACQWWTDRQLLQRHLQLSWMQHVLVEAPGLLLLAAAPPSVHAPHRQPSAARTEWQAVEASSSIHAADMLEARHQALYQALHNLLQGDGHQQQQPPQKRPSTTRSSIQQRQQPQVTSTTDDGLLLQLRAVAVLEPNIIAQPASLVASQVAQLSRVLLLTPRQLFDAALHCPAVLWLTGQQIFERVRVVCGITQLPAHLVRQKLLDPTVLPVLLMDADSLRDSSHALLEAAARGGYSEEKVKQLARDMPQLLLPGNSPLAIGLLCSKE